MAFNFNIQFNFREYKLASVRYKIPILKIVIKKERKYFVGCRL